MKSKTETKTRIKIIIFIALSVIIFVAFNVMILQKEHILENGQTVLLELAPVDPRSLIQGDYMALRYKIATGSTERALIKEEREGKIVMQLDEHNVAKFIRIYRGENLKSEERLLNFKNRRGLRFGAESFFFQEGHAQYYNNARYGELKVASNGESVLVGLRDNNFRKLGPKLNDFPN